MRCLLETLKRTPKRYQDPVLWVWLEYVSPLRGTSSKATYYLLSFFFYLYVNTLASIARTPNVDLLRLKTLRDTCTYMYQNHIFNDESPAGCTCLSF